MIHAALLLASLALAAGEGPVATVDGVAITAADVQERLRALAGVGRSSTPAQAVTDLCDQVLLAAEARRLGLDRRPAVQAEIARQRRRLVVNAFVDGDLAKTAEPSEEYLRSLYRSSADTARLVLVKVTTEAEARGVLSRVRAGGDLAAEARRGVDARLAQSGGDTGPLTRGALEPKLAEAVFAAEPGALVGPVQLQLGWAVARVVERKVGDEAGFQAQRPMLRAYAGRQLLGQAKAHYTEQLVKGSGAKIDEAFLASIDPKATPTDAQLDHVLARFEGGALRYRDVHASVARLAAGAGGHLAGPQMRLNLARAELESMLLEQAALKRGYGSAAGPQSVMPGIERSILASEAAARIAADAKDPRAVERRVAALRGKASIQIDEARVKALSGAATP